MIYVRWLRKSECQYFLIYASLEWLWMFWKLYVNSPKRQKSLKMAYALNKMFSNTWYFKNPSYTMKHQTPGTCWNTWWTIAEDEGPLQLSGILTGHFFIIWTLLSKDLFLAAVMKISQTGWFKQQKFSSHSSGNWKPKIKVLAYSVSRESMLPGLQMGCTVCSHGREQREQE